MCLIIGIFIVTNTIPYILNIIEALKPDLMAVAESSTIPFVIMDISNTLIVLNCSATIFVYYCYSCKFRSALMSRTWLKFKDNKKENDSDCNESRQSGNFNKLIKLVKNSRTAPLPKRQADYQPVDVDYIVNCNGEYDDPIAV